jgi:hypothetical protein
VRLAVGIKSLPADYGAVIIRRYRPAARDPDRAENGRTTMTDNGQASGLVQTAARPASAAPGSGAGASLDDPRVLQAMEEYLKLLQAGERPKRHTFLGRYPDVADALALCLQGLDFVHAAGAELSQAATGRGGVAGMVVGDTGAPAEALGDFRIVREVGRGGMGVVYEASNSRWGGGWR